MKNEEWLFGDDIELEYHMKQYDDPKFYTKKILDYLNEWEIIKDECVILDIGCGCGSVTNFLSKNFNNVFFDGIDINQNYINIANNKKTENSNFYCQDMMIKNNKKYDGILSLHPTTRILVKY